MIDLGALLRVPGVEVEMGFDISPDGQRVAFSWNPEGHWEIYEIRLSGGLGNNKNQDPKPRLVSHGPGAKFHPQYSPDGKTLAYVVDFDGSERFHIFLFDFVRKEQHDLTPNEIGSLQPNFSWSPDSSRLAYISDQSGQFDAYVLSLSNGDSYHMLDAGFPAWKVVWSPDGRWLAVVVEASGIDYGTYIVPIQGGLADRIMEDNVPIDAGQASWSPDSRFLAFSSDIAGLNNIGIYEIATRQIRWLTNGDGEKQFPSWSQDGSMLTYVFNRGTVSWLAVQKPGHSPQLYQVEPGVHYHPGFTPDGRYIIFAFDNPRHPDDLWSLSLSSGDFTQLTHSLPENLSDAPFILPEEVTYPGMDGVLVPALLFKPKTHDPGPAVLFVHGGPDWFFEMTWYSQMIHMASRGWVILAPNYRGSTGYGRAWQEASRFDFGGVDTDDVVSGANFLIREGLADPQRIAITGRSHGGYLAASCMTRYPELWVAGSAVVPFLNWFTNHDGIRPDLQQWDLENFGNPVEDHDLWKERSPSFFLDKIQAPLQLICGRLDARCPVSDSIAAEASLREMGKEVELIMYEDEGHTFLNMHNVLDSELRRVKFLERFLKKTGRGK